MGPTPSGFYAALDDALAATIAGPAGFREYVQAGPVGLPNAAFVERERRLDALRLFFEVVSQVFREVVAGEASPRLARLLFNDAPANYGIEFHRALPREVWTVPRFFRTDESQDGKILELQCPGSGWGDLPLLTALYGQYFKSDALAQYKPAMLVAEEIARLCGKTNASVLHLLDNASNPTSMRYLIATTQPPLRYWGYERSVRNDECDFVRSHSFYGLVAENLFKKRVRDAAEGRVLFDLPPAIVFDQKMPLCLPFLEETRDRFSDWIRAILCYSTPVFEDGFADVNGEWVTIENFLKRPPSQRRYFVKYAGSDVSLNWGSRGVFRLSDKKGAELLRMAAVDASRGRFWLIQPEVSGKEQVVYINRVDGNPIQETLTSKVSCFYGPTRLVGIRTMHRRHFKVHGQDDTVLGLAVPQFYEESGTDGGRRGHA